MTEAAAQFHHISVMQTPNSERMACVWVGGGGVRKSVTITGASVCVWGGGGGGRLWPLLKYTKEKKNVFYCTTNHTRKFCPRSHTKNG